MKNVIALMISMCVFSGAQAAQTVHVTGTLQNSSSQEAVVAMYAEYTATRDLVTCKDHSLPELKPRSYAKIKQQLILMKGNRFQADLPGEFGFCKYKLSSAGIVVVNPEIVANILKMGGDRVAENTIEFTGGVSNLARVKGGEQTRGNDLNCKWGTSLSAECDSQEVISNGAAIDLTVKVQN